jgi:lysine-N-methylase
MTAAGSPNHTAFRYMTRFECSGSACGDSCCRGGWQIHVDQPHYKKLRDAMDATPALRREFDESVRRVKDSTRSRGKFALHVLDQNGACKLLRPDGLCSVHARWGESHLSDTCAIYPRVVSRTAGRFELGGSLSCPEVARQVLLHDDALELVVAPPSVFARPIVFQELGDHPAAPYLRFHDELKNLAVDLLGDARFPLKSRLGFVAWFANRVGAFLDAKSTTLDEARLGAELEIILDPSMRTELDQRFGAIAPDTTLGAKVAVPLLAAGTRNNGTEGLRRLLDGALVTYVGSGEHDAAAAAAGYAAARTRLAADAPFIDAILANYARHYWLREWYTTSPSLLAHHLKLLVRLAAIRFVALGQPGLADAPSPDVRRERLAAALVDTVQKFARVFEHDREFTRVLQAELAGAGMITLAHATCLASF